MITLTTTDTFPSDLNEHPPTNISNSPETSKEKTKREIQQLFENLQFTENFWYDDINQNKLTSDSISSSAPLLPKSELPNNIKKHCFENPTSNHPNSRLLPIATIYIHKMISPITKNQINPLTHLKTLPHPSLHLKPLLHLSLHLKHYANYPK